MEKLKRNNRHERIWKIKHILFNSFDKGERVEYKYMISKFCLEQDISRRTCMEYIQLLIDNGIVKKVGKFLMKGDNT